MTLTFLAQFLNATLLIGLAWLIPNANRLTQTNDAAREDSSIRQSSRRAVNRYRLGIGVTAACWLVTALTVHGATQALVVHHLMPVLAALVILVLLQRCKFTHKDSSAEEPVKADAKLGTTDPTETENHALSGHPWVLWITALVLVAAMNTHVAYHYGKSADATLRENGLHVPGIWGAFALPAVALAVTFLSFALSFMTPTSYSTSPKQEVRDYARATATRSLRGALAITAVACNALFLVIVLDLVPDDELNQNTFIAALSFVVAAIIGVSLWLKKRAAIVPAHLEPAGGEDCDTDVDTSWKWKLLYFNKNNPNVWVGSRRGFGHTLNFARWEVWLLAAVLAIPLGLALVTRV